jgi:organic radical activating enzyme
MLSIELMNEYITALGKFNELDKAELESLVNLLTEYREIEDKIKKIRGLINNLIETKKIDKYIELNGKIYCLETLEEFELIEANQSDITGIAKIEKKIQQELDSYDKMLEQQDVKINSLSDIKNDLLEKIFLTSKKKAIKTDELLIIQKTYERIILFKD